jgi:hypothetical protein
MQRRPLTRSQCCTPCTLCVQGDEVVRANNACECGYALCAQCIASLEELECPKCRRVLVGVPANPMIRAMIAWSQDLRQRSAFIASKQGREFVRYIESVDNLTDRDAPALVERLLQWVRASPAELWCSGLCGSLGGRRVSAITVCAFLAGTVAGMIAACVACIAVIGILVLGTGKA